MKRFIYQIEKSEEKDGVKLRIFYVNNKKETNIEEIMVPYTIFANKTGFESLKIDSESIFLTNREFKDKNQEKIVKIEIKNKELYEYVTSQLKENEVNTYEQDLLKEHSYLIENNIPISTIEKTSLKHLSIDIETIENEQREQEIIMISIQSPQDKRYNKVYVDLSKIDKNKITDLKNTQFEGFEAIFLEDEKQILEKFRDDVIEYAPQVILGWNVIDFDFKVIRDRMKIWDLDFKFSKYGEECKLRINSDFFRDSSMVCSGVLIFDAIQLLKSNFIVFEDYKLDTVARNVLGDNKIELQEEGDFIEDKLLAIKHLLKTNPKKLIEYNFKDSLLTSQINEKLNLLDLMIQRSIITDTPVQKVKSPIAALDIMYLKELHKKGYVASTNFNYNQTTPIEGAFVVEPKRGFYKDIYVLDFKSLYPSIIMTFNIDPFTYNNNGQIKAPNGAKFDKTTGILPELIQKIYKERDVAKKEKNEIKSYARKTTMNSFYGAMASPKCRLYNKEVGGAITAFARFIIQKAKKYIEDLGHDVIYGDTDSIFVSLKEKYSSAEERKNAGFLIEEDLNKYFKSWIEKDFKQKNYLNIELEKIYSKFFIASKKRYVGIDEFTNKIQFVGMEAIRGDWTDLAKNFQKRIVDLIFSDTSKEEIEKFVKDEIKFLNEGKYDDLLIYKKKITKALEGYTKITPPHVKAAREVPNFSGRLVQYVMTKSGPKHISLIDKGDELDYEHYIEKQLKGVSDDLLESFGIDFNKIIEQRDQKSLDRFF